MFSKVLLPSFENLGLIKDDSWKKRFTKFRRSTTVLEATNCSHPNIVIFLYNNFNLFITSIPAIFGWVEIRKQTKKKSNLVLHLLEKSEKEGIGKRKVPNTFWKSEKPNIADSSRILSLQFSKTLTWTWEKNARSENCNIAVTKITLLVETGNQFSCRSVFSCIVKF